VQCRLIAGEGIAQPSSVLEQHGMPYAGTFYQLNTLTAACKKSEVVACPPKQQKRMQQRYLISRVFPSPTVQLSKALKESHASTSTFLICLCACLCIPPHLFLINFGIGSLVFLTGPSPWVPIAPVHLHILHIHHLFFVQGYFRFFFLIFLFSYS
jgi:hypothetical protein